jgi:hypothetical protein
VIALSPIRPILLIATPFDNSFGRFVADLRILSKPYKPFSGYLKREALGVANRRPCISQLALALARMAARNLQLMMNATNMGPAHNVAFNPENLNAQLNSILFESPSLGEAMTKLRLAQQQAEDFISDIERALRPN